MNVFILIDNALGMHQKTHFGISKLEFAKSLASSLYKELCQPTRNDCQVWLFDSSLHANSASKELALSKDPYHALSVCKRVEPSPTSDLFQSLKTVLHFKRFLDKADLQQKYFGNRTTDDPATVL